MSFVNENFKEIESLRINNKKQETLMQDKYQIFKYGDSFYGSLEVLDRFKKTILTHIISLYLMDNGEYLPPMYLAIEGSAGQGKTSQAIATCIQHGCIVFYISASQLSGSHEGEAIDVIESVYKHAIVELKRNGPKPVIVIDDFHLSNASIDDNVKRTINSTLLTGYLMNLTQNKDNIKIPIILTGNDFSKVYGPLIRSGRADIFKWEPNYEEKKNLVKKLYSNFVLFEEDEFECFFQKCSSASIADFSQLKNDYRKLLIAENLNKIRIINDSLLRNLSIKIRLCNDKLNFDMLMRLAEERHMMGEENDRYKSIATKAEDRC